MKATFLYIMLTLLVMNVFAQKQTFDVVSFSIPQGWQQQQNEGGMQLSVTDKNSGGYDIAVITKAIVSDKDANVNFMNQWTSLVKTAVWKQKPV
ncbi:MAG: hypothetical protein V4541_08135 [Bacteroidota bacterium]